MRISEAAKWSTELKNKISRAALFYNKAAPNIYQNFFDIKRYVDLYILTRKKLQSHRLTSPTFLKKLLFFDKNLLTNDMTCGIISLQEKIKGIFYVEQG